MCECMNVLHFVILCGRHNARDEILDFYTITYSVHG